MPPATQGTILLTGASGFIGGHLHDPLEGAGFDVRCLSRSPEQARQRPGWKWVRGDVGDDRSVERALAGCRIAYYLVHGMAGAPRGWADRERRNAATFAAAGARVGLERIIYLGGMAPRGRPSAHIAARLATGESLRAGKVPCLELRAAMIVGCGSASWQIVRDLAARLPGMVLPRWLESRSEPVWVGDVTGALLAAATLPLPAARVEELPGPEALSGREILERVAEVLGRRPFMIGVPFVTPFLSAQWIRLVTRADYRLAVELVAGLTSDLLATRSDFWERAGLPAPVRLEEAARRALAEEVGREPRKAQLVEALANAVTRRA